MSKEEGKKELLNVKIALREMMKLARNVVLEKVYLFYSHIQIPKDYSDRLNPVEKTPFLITKKIP